MDRNSLIAIVLITILVIIWMVWMSVNQVPPKDTTEKPPQTSEEIATKDTIPQEQNNKEKTEEQQPVQNDTSATQLNKYVELYGETFAGSVHGKEQLIKIENELVKVYLSTRGAVIKKWYLKDFKTWNQYTTQLIWTSYGVPGLTLSSRETGKEIDTRHLYFKINNATKHNYVLKGDDSITISMTLEPKPGKKITKTYTFYGNKYHVDVNVTLENFDDILTNKGYKFEWVRGLRYQEPNSVDESNSAEAQVSINGEIFTLDAKEYNLLTEKKTGVIDYAAMKIKYFTAAIKPKPERSFDGTVVLEGQRWGAPDNGIIERYNIAYIVPYRGGKQSRSFQIYIGPIDYDILNEYGLEKLVNLGWKFIIRPIGEFFMLPFFLFIYKLIGNYGISIILFSIVMKIILYPLSIQQMRSAHKMKIIGAEVAKVREKYKDDQKKQQQELMKVYSTYGINPAGGCLPLLLQMPILYALWVVLRSSIELRQADFALWIHDLSLPDSIVTLPFPIFGITSISGLALLMGITMFIQQKMTLTDPKQKAMVYMMPIMFTLMFSYFPSGLNLYYFVFNLLGILQQLYINNYSKNKLTLEDLKKMPKKESWFTKKMREAQEIAQAQGKTLPGQKPMPKKQNPQRRKKKKR
jgi:YidC/Oxa1 family membrane protein insertase